MLWFIAAFLFLVAVVLLLRLRVRLVFGNDRQLVAASLGRTGPEIDFDQRLIHVRLFGRTIHTRPLPRRQPKAAPEPETTDEISDEQPPKADAKDTPKRRWNWRAVLAEWRTILRALRTFVRGVWRDIIFEEAAVTIEIGSNGRPDLVGMAYGWHQAALGASPSAVSWLQFVPRWGTSTAAGEIRFTAAIRLYRLLYRGIRLLWEIRPWRIYRALRSTREQGGGDGGQSRN